MEENTNSTGDSTPENTELHWKSDKIDKLASALSKAQSEMKGAEKKSINPFFNSGYADLHTVIESSFPHLTKNGLSAITGIAQYDDDGNVASHSKGITKNHAKTVTTNQGA